MKWIFSLILSFSLVFAFCQFDKPINKFKPWNFNTIKPLYYHQIQDLHHISEISDGYNCFVKQNNMFLLDENYIYFLLHFIYDGDYEGATLIKYNLDNGKEEWKYSYNLSNNLKQEIPSHLKFNNDGNLEIISYKRKKTKDDNTLFPFLLFDLDCSVSRRIVNKENGGEILNESFDDVSIAWQSGFTDLRKLSNGNYVYFRNVYNRQNNANVAISKFDNTFQLIDSDTVYGFMDTTRFAINRNNSIEDIENGIFYLTKKFFSTNQTYLYRVTLEGEILDSFSLEYDPNYITNNISHFKDSVFIGTVTYEDGSFGLPHENYIIYDSNGNIIQKTPSRLDGKYSIVEAINYDKDNFTMTTYTDPKAANPSSPARVSIFEIEDGTPTLKASLPYNDSLKYCETDFILPYKNKVLMIFTERAIYYKSIVDGYKDDPNAVAISFALFNASDLGLSTSNKETTTEVLDLYPNPTLGLVHIDLGLKITEINVFPDLSALFFSF